MSPLKSSVAACTSSLQGTTIRLHSTTNYLVRKNSRASLLAAGAATAGLLGGACTIAAAAPWDQVATSNVSSTVHGGSLPSSGHSGTSALDVFGGAVHASQPTRGSNAAKSAPVKAATTARGSKPAKRQARRPAANPGPSKPYLVYDSVTPNTLPSGRPAAVYANGAYAVSGSKVARHD